MRGFLPGQDFQVGILGRIGQDGLLLIQLAAHLAKGGVGLDEGSEVAVFLGEGAVTGLVGNDGGIAQALRYFLVAFPDSFQIFVHGAASEVRPLASLVCNGG